MALHWELVVAIRGKACYIYIAEGSRIYIRGGADEVSVEYQVRSDHDRNSVWMGGAQGIPGALGGEWLRPMEEFVATCVSMSGSILLLLPYTRLNRPVYFNAQKPFLEDDMVPWLRAPQGTSLRQ